MKRSEAKSIVQMSSVAYISSIMSIAGEIIWENSMLGSENNVPFPNEIAVGKL